MAPVRLQATPGQDGAVSPKALSRTNFPLVHPGLRPYWTNPVPPPQPLPPSRRQLPWCQWQRLHRQIQFRRQCQSRSLRSRRQCQDRHSQSLWIHRYLPLRFHLPSNPRSRNHQLRQRQKRRRPTQLHSRTNPTLMSDADSEA